MVWSISALSHIVFSAKRTDSNPPGDTHDQSIGIRSIMSSFDPNTRRMSLSPRLNMLPRHGAVVLMLVSWTAHSMIP